MTALVAVETVLLVLLVVLVAGLLRSHAEILRRLGPGGAGDPVGATLPRSAPATVAREPGTPAPEVAGRTPDGGAVKLSLSGAGAIPTLLAFLSSGCTTCHRFWEDLGERPLPGGVGLVVVTHDETRESPARLRSLTPPGVTVVMSSQAYRDYGVPGAPYFVLVEDSVRGEGVATTWPALESLLTDAIADAAADPGGPARADRIEARLAAAGIAPGDPSLYPGSAGAPDKQ
ncbi:MAG TPA: hypothetical protein VG295_07765 [Solirubrobacteraceae bacterium]|jgi:hypothetical protein|nr:hypothetical protein [Solirubrobacteraceae bacterium]